jgi:hypothetical protein
MNEQRPNRTMIKEKNKNTIKIVNMKSPHFGSVSNCPRNRERMYPNELPVL